MSDLSASERELIDKLNEFIQNNLDNEHYGVSELADDLGMGRSNLLKKVKAITKITASQYIRQFRLKRAMEILQQTSLTVSEVSYKTGFNSPSYFVKCFHDFFGYSPGEVKKRNENEERTPIRSNKKQISIIFPAVFFLVVIIVVLIIVVKPFSNHQEKLEKTIAVIPFIDDSPEKGNTYIINGLMEEILDKLQNIGDLKVKSRTDTEKYRDTKKSITEIAKELNVNYIIEGSGQVIGDQIKLSVQLIECSSGVHILSHIYTKDIKDIFTLQEDVAFSVASELKASLTHEEEQQIEKQLTENPTAYHLYLRGMDHIKTALNYSGHSKRSLEKNEYEQAKKCFKQAIEIDSTFTEAYIQLSHYYIDVIYPQAAFYPHLQHNYLDSGLTFASKAVKYDPKSGWATALMGNAYRQMGMEKEAEIWEKKHTQILYDLNFPDYKIYKAQMDKAHKKEDNYNNIKHYYKYIETKPKELATEIYLLKNIYEAFDATGYPGLAKSVAQEILTRNNDSTGYLQKLDRLNFLYGNNGYKASQFKTNDADSTQMHLIKRVYWIRPWIESNFDFFKIMQKEIDTEGEPDDTLFVNYDNGYVLMQNNYKYEFRYMAVFIKNFTEQIEVNLPRAQKYYSHLNLAYLYAMSGEKEMASEYLKQTQNRETGLPYMAIRLLKINPIWDDYQSNPEFQKILTVLEAKYEKEHERIGKLLRDLGKL